MNKNLQQAFEIYALLFSVIISLVLLNTSIDFYIIFFASGLVISLIFLVIMIYKFSRINK